MKLKIKRVLFFHIVILLTLSLLSACGATKPKISQLIAKPEKNATSIQVIYITNSISDPKFPKCYEKFDDPKLCAGSASSDLSSVKFFGVGEKISTTTPVLLAKRNISSNVDLIPQRKLNEFLSNLKINKSGTQTNYLLLYFTGGHTVWNSQYGSVAYLNLNAQYRDIQTNKIYWQGAYDVEANNNLLQNLVHSSNFNEKYVEKMIRAVLMDMEKFELIPIEKIN